MRFEWRYSKEIPNQVKTFLREQGVSKALLAKIKFKGGSILVNQKIENVLYKLKAGDVIAIEIPNELPHETLLAEQFDLQIVFEDEHFLLINKPAGYASIPSQYHPNQTIANFAKGYFQKNNYPNQVIHIVTRLDKDTSGLMLFAKHGFAHALMDKSLRLKGVTKKYQAIVSNSANLADNGEIIAPIGRNYDSLIERQVTEDGKYAHTSYQKLKAFDEFSLVDILLHTGRTHQIRVHFSHIGSPLLGDDLYGGSTDLINRQALHCYSIGFFHPFLKEQLEFEIPLPDDMSKLIIN